MNQKSDSVSSMENFDVDAHNSGGVSQISNLQSIRMLSNNKILSGTRFEDKQRQEKRTRVLLAASRSADGGWSSTDNQSNTGALSLYSHMTNQAKKDFQVV